MADLEISVEINAKQTKKGAADAKSAIKDVGDEAEKTGKKAKNAAERDLAGLNTKMAQAGAFAKSMAGALAIAAVGIAAIAAAALKAADIIFRLAKGFAEYAGEIGRAQKVTGLSAETLSALRHQAESAGSSFKDLTSGLKTFIKTIGDANNGKDEAIAKLNRLGIDGKKAVTDLEGAFRKALETIVKMPPGVQRTNAMIDAFGDNAEKMGPILASFGGDLDQVIAKAREMGITLSEDDVRAADEFNKSLAQVQAMVRNVAYTFGRELLPIVKSTLDDVNSFLRTNKDEVKSWARDVADAVAGLKVVLQNEWVQMAADALTFFNPLRMIYNALRQIGIESGSRQPKPLTDRATQLEGRTPATTPLPDLNYFTPGGGGRATRRGAGRAKESPQVKEARELSRILTDLNIQIEFHGQTTKEAAVQQQLMRIASTGTNEVLRQQAVELAKQVDALDASAQAAKELDAAEKKLQEAFAGAEAGIVSGAASTQFGLEGDLQALEQRIALGRELTEVERQSIANQIALRQLGADLKALGLDDKQIEKLKAIAAARQQDNLELTKNIQLGNQKLALDAAVERITADLDAEIHSLNVQLGISTELSRADAIAKLLQTEAYDKLTDATKKGIIAKAQEADALREAVKAQEEARRAYDEVYQTIRGHLDVLANEGFGGFFKSIYRQFQSFLRDLIAEWLTSKFFQMFFKGGNQSQAAASGQGNGGIFGGIMNAIFGGGQGGNFGIGPGGTPTFNFGGAGAGGNINFGGGQGSGNRNINFGGVGAGAAGGGRQFRQLFQGGLSTGIGLASVGAGILGGAIGGTAGNIISLAGTGLGIGFMLGGPIGAAIGAGIGALGGVLMRVFGGDPKRKRDKKEKLPALNQGFNDALQQLRDLLRDVRTLRVDPDSAIARATELRQQIASGFGIQFESKKYRKQAQTLIRQRLGEADTLIEELRRAAEISRAAGERERRIIPEFASGVFMSRQFMEQMQSFRRVNGMMPGTFTGRDSINARLAPGELVLNPAQQSRVRANAGGDPFRGAGIPGYANGGVVAAAPSEPTELTFVFEHSIDAEGLVKTQLKNSDAVNRELRIRIEDMSANDRLRQKRRGS